MALYDDDPFGTDYIDTGAPVYQSDWFQDTYGEQDDEIIARYSELQEAQQFVTDITESGEARPFDHFSRLGDKLVGAVTMGIDTVAGRLIQREVDRLAPLQPVSQPRSFIQRFQSPGGQINWLFVLLAVGALFGAAMLIPKK